MGAINGKDILSSKYPTAIIIDSAKAIHFVSIKNPIGDYFFAVINKQLYAFSLQGDMFSYRQTLAKTFGVYIYFTDHYKPISSHIKELELILDTNDLPRLSLMMYKALKLLGQKEKKQFETHKIMDLITQLSKAKENDPDVYEENQNIINFLEGLSITEIVTPVKRVTEYLDDSFLATDPGFMGAVKTALKLLLTENREVNHTPITPKKSIIVMIMAVAMVGLVIGLVYFANESGVFEGIGSSISGAVGGMTEKSIMEKYPSGAALVAAVDSGEVSYDSLPPAAKEIYDSTPKPTIKQ